MPHIDPVCAMSVDDSTSTEYNSKTYFFCSDHCQKIFSEKPQNYVPRKKVAAIIGRAIFFGILSSSILLGIYFFILTLVSGWTYTLLQFEEFWPYIISLSLGFGIQITLYNYLKNRVRNKNAAGNIVAVSGTTSTAAMISCCTHYLVNILPILGVTGFLAIVTQYQTDFFWIGLLSNAFGIGYILYKIIQLEYPKKESLRTILPISLIFIIIVLWVFDSVPNTNIQNSQETLPVTTSEEEVSNTFTSQINEEGPVTVSIQPLAGTFTANAKSWKFQVDLNTHSVEIDDDIMQALVLIDDTGVQYTPILWDGDPSGGHHRGGIIEFVAPSVSSTTFTIEARGIGDIEKRIFLWEL